MYQLTRYAEHYCRLPSKGSESNLPQLGPRGGFWAKFRRRIHKLTIVYNRHPSLRTYFRSSAAIIFERRRHIFGYPCYIIHPLSILSICNDMLAIVLWLYSFIVDPFLAAFWSGETQFTTLTIITIFVNILLSLQCGIWFVSGYFVAKTNEIELKPKKIALRYLRKFFIWDILGCFPLRLFLLPYMQGWDEIYHNLIFLIGCLKMVRIKSLFKRMKLIVIILSLSEFCYGLFTLIILTVLLLHWCTCGFFIYNAAMFYIQGYEDSYSVLNELKISPSFTKLHWTKRYVKAIYVVTELFCNSGQKLAYSYSTSEQPILTCLMIFGAVYYVICFFGIYLLLSSLYTPEQAYENFMDDVEVFMDAKNLPIDLRQRILVYYTRRYQYKYYKEASLTSFLSEHLQHEIWLHSCQRLLDQVKFFRKLPKSVVGLILGSLKQEVFLPRDVILTADDLYGNMFFISWGTVAVFTRENLELLHLSDGMHFGLPPINKLRTTCVNYTFVAVEMTECYRWDKEGYQRCVNTFKGIVDIVEEVYIHMNQEMLEREESLRKYKNPNILSELQQGRILEQGFLRKRDIHKFRR